MNVDEKEAIAAPLNLSMSIIALVVLCTLLCVNFASGFIPSPRAAVENLVRHDEDVHPDDRAASNYFPTPSVFHLPHERKRRTIMLHSVGPPGGVEEDTILGGESATTTLVSDYLETYEVNLAEKIQVLIYRLLFCGSAIAITTYAGTTLLDGLGISQDTLETAQRYAGLAFVEFSVICAVATPKDILTDLDSYSDLQLSQIFGTILPTLGLAGQLIIIAFALLQPDSFMAGAELHSLFSFAAIPLSAVCAREIYFYGLPYKVEALLSIILLLGLVITNFPLQSPVVFVGALALSLSVLAAGKVFEPLLEDLRPGKSSFFVK